MTDTGLSIKIRHAKRQNSQNLDLSNMGIEIIPSEIYQLKNLLFLNLSNNKINEIDKEIENLKNLKELVLDNNNIKNLPQEILNLSNLSTLKLNNNPICSYLKDYAFNWKISLKEFIQSGGTQNVNNLVISSSTSNNEKITLKKISLKNENHTRPLTGYGFKKNIGEIPKCNLFESSANNTMSNFNNSKDNSPIRVDINKMDAIKNINKKIKITNTISHSVEKQSSNLSDEENYDFDNVDVKVDDIGKDEEISKLKHTIQNLENEIQNLTINKKKEEELKQTISKLETELRIVKMRSESSLGNNDKKMENVITNKRNWMDTPNTNLVSNDFSSKRVEDSDGKGKDLENQLQKEILNNKRMKNEIERLSQQVALAQGQGAFNSSDFLKSNLYN